MRSDVFVHGPNTPRRLLSVETSTTKAKAFVDALLQSKVLSDINYTLTSREVRAIVSDVPLASLTRPMSEPFPDIVQDLWQLSHVTASYVARAAAGAILLARAFSPTIPLQLKWQPFFYPSFLRSWRVSFGIWTRDRRLMFQGLLALLVSTALALAGGAAVGWIVGGPIRYASFKNSLSSFAISAVIGTAAGLSITDDAGRR